MATIFDSVDITGLRRTHFNQLLSYLSDCEQQRWHYGNKEQFTTRHDRYDTKTNQWLSGSTRATHVQEIDLPKEGE